MKMNRSEIMDFTEQEFVGEELENVEPEEEDPDDSDLENLSFDDDYLGEE